MNSLSDDLERIASVTQGFKFQISDRIGTMYEISRDCLSLLAGVILTETHNLHFFWENA